MPIQRNASRTIAFTMSDMFGGPVTGTPTCKVSKDGGAFTACANAPVQVSGGNGGEWVLTLTATEMDAAVVVVEAVLTGAVTVAETIYPEASYTDTKAGYLDSAVSSRLASSAYVAPDNAGIGTAAATVASNLDAKVSSRLASADYISSDNADIAAIKAKTDMLGSGNITLVSSLISPNWFAVYQGYSYLAVDGTNITFTTTGPDLTGAVVTLVVPDEAKTKVCDVTVLASNSVSIELTSAQTAALSTGTKNYLLTAVLANGHSVIIGPMTVTVY